MNQSELEPLEILDHILYLKYLVDHFYGPVNFFNIKSLRFPHKANYKNK